MKRPPRDLFVGLIGANAMAAYTTTGWTAYLAAAWVVVLLFIVVNWPDAS